MSDKLHTTIIKYAINRLKDIQNRYVVDQQAPQLLQEFTILIDIYLNHPDQTINITPLITGIQSVVSAAVKKPHHRSTIPSRIPKEYQIPSVLDNLDYHTTHVGTMVNFARGIDIIHRYCQENDLPSEIGINAVTIYQRLMKIRKNGHIKRNAAAALYITLMEQHRPILLKRLFTELQIPAFRRMMSYINKIYIDLELKPSRITPIDYLPQLTDHFGLDETSQQLFITFVEKLKPFYEIVYYLKTAAPSNVAAGILYIISLLQQLRLTQNTIADFFEITAVTLRKSYQTIAELLGLPISTL